MYSSALHAAQGYALHDVAGQEEIHDEHGQDGDGQRQEYHAVISAEGLAHQHLHEHGQRFLAGGVDDQTGQEQAAPVCHKLKDSLYRQGRLHDGQHDSVECMEFA